MLEGYKKVSVDIPEAHLTQLKESAKKNDTDLSKLLRLIIKIYLE